MGIVLFLLLLAGFLLVVGWLAVSEPRQAGTPRDNSGPARPATDAIRIIDLDAVVPAGLDEGARDPLRGRVDEPAG
jgi:hypothetical protein